MSTVGHGALLASLFLTGLAGSLHCVGMGPTLVNKYGSQLLTIAAPQ
jgi:sulfite exporter TauE/SafE